MEGFGRERPLGKKKGNKSSGEIQGVKKVGVYMYLGKAGGERRKIRTSGEKAVSNEKKRRRG